jgi:hypothetical protein
MQPRTPSTTPTAMPAFTPLESPVGEEELLGMEDWLVEVEVASVVPMPIGVSVYI